MYRQRNEKHETGLTQLDLSVVSGEGIGDTALDWYAA